MIRTRQIIVKKNHILYSYFDNVTIKATALYNKTLFYLRHAMTAVKHSPEEWNAQERRAMQELQTSLPQMNNGSERYQLPTADNWCLSYNFMYAFFKVTKNTVFYAEGLPSNVAQNVVYSACSNMQKYAQGSTGKMKWHLPKYIRGIKRHRANFPALSLKHGMTDEGRFYLQFPKTKSVFYLKPIDLDVYKIVRVFVKYQYGDFFVSVVLDDGLEPPQLSDSPKRICAIDIGVNNFAAVTNNIGYPSMLYKGGAAKSANETYNYKLSKIRQIYFKDGNYKIKSLPAYNEACITRDKIVKDYIFQVSKSIVDWCVNNDIDTIVVGNMGYKLTQDKSPNGKNFFVPLPFAKFRQTLKDKSQMFGIRYIEVDESYTSQASFMDGDKCVNQECPEFSGFRGPIEYRGFKNNFGLYGLYQTADGTIVNADLNASANIGHKAYPSLFNKDTVDISNGVLIFEHPCKEPHYAI